MAATRTDGDDLHAQVAQVAIQQGRHAAEQILAREEDRPTRPFRYTDYGQMATIGRNAAVAEFPTGLTFKGLFAWLVWVVVHIAKLVGFRNRVSVFTDWIYNYFTYDRHAQLIVGGFAGSEKEALTDPSARGPAPGSEPPVNPQ